MQYKARMACCSALLVTLLAACGFTEVESSDDDPVDQRDPSAIEHMVQQRAELHNAGPN